MSGARAHANVQLNVQWNFNLKIRLSAFLSSVCVYVFVYFFFAIDNFVRVFFFLNITIEFTIGVNARHSRSFTD